MYYRIEENDDNHMYFKIHEIMSIIQLEKQDVIYRSAFPRLKQTHRRGVQALKFLILQLCKKYHDENYKIEFNESVKNLWLDCFKLIYKCEIFAEIKNSQKVLYIPNEIKKNECIKILSKFEFFKNLEIFNEDSEIPQICNDLNFELITEIENEIKNKLTKKEIHELIKIIL